MSRPLALFAITLLVGCSQQDAETSRPSQGAAAPASRTTGAENAAAEPALLPAPGRAHRFTSLTDCRVIREERTEMPFVETLCRGAAGWALQIADSDARQSLTLVDPTGARHPLDTSRMSGGAFNSFGETAEWRGDLPAAGERFAPDSLIVRYRIAEQPYPAPETSYLLAIRLGARPCLIVRIPPGPGQNDAARDAADGNRACSPAVR